MSGACGLTGLMGDAADACCCGAHVRRYVEVSFVWGINGIDRSDFVVWEPGQNRGTAVFRDAFDLSTKEAQDFILGTCQALRDRTCSQPGCTEGKLTLPGEVECWPEEFLTWYTVRAVAA